MSKDDLKKSHDVSIKEVEYLRKNLEAAKKSNGTAFNFIWLSWDDADKELEVAKNQLEKETAKVKSLSETVARLELDIKGEKDTKDKEEAQDTLESQNSMIGSLKQEVEDFHLIDFLLPLLNRWILRF